MNIILVGAGAVGFNLAKQLTQEGHDVAVIERDLRVLETVRDQLDVMAVRGHGSNPRILEEAGVREADMMIAVTDSDEVNVVVCLLADRFGVKHKIARVRSSDLSESNTLFRDRPLPIDLIVNPETITVDLVLKLIETPGATDAVDFADGEILLRGFNVPPDAPIANRTLAELREAWEGEAFLVLCVLREGKTLIIPRGDEVLQPNDEIYVMLPQHTLPLLLPMVNRRSNEVRRVAIYGAGTRGRSLAVALEGRGIDVVLIEPDPGRADLAAAELERGLVLRGHATELEILTEANIETVSFFIAAYDNDELNLLAALLAKKNGAARAIVITGEPDYVAVMKSIDIHVVVNPRLVTVGAILRHVRRGRTITVAKLSDSGAEAVESVVAKGSAIVGRPLREAKLPKGAIVGAIWREREVIIPTGETVVQPGDDLVVFALPEAVSRVQSLLSS